MVEAPEEMTSGDEAVVWMELRNDGNVTWDLDRTRIGTQDPQDRESAFFVDGNWLSPSRPTGADHSSYGPGVVGRFTWVMRAPEVTQSTRFDEAFQPVQEGVTWFGPTTTMSILVHPRRGPTEPDAGDPGPGADGDAGVDPGPDGGEPAGGCRVGGGTSSGAALPWLLAAAALFVRRRRRPRSPTSRRWGTR
jgi:MYXO-CTERM domain-containing protein